MADERCYVVRDCDGEHWWRRFDGICGGTGETSQATAQRMSRDEAHSVCVTELAKRWRCRPVRLIPKRKPKAPRGLHKPGLVAEPPKQVFIIHNDAVCDSRTWFYKAGAASDECLLGDRVVRYVLAEGE